jgi:hypothetical protein
VWQILTISWQMFLEEVLDKSVLHRHLLVSYKKIKEPVLVCSHGSLTNLKKSQNQTKVSQLLCQYFHENHWFFNFKFFQRRGIGGSLSLQHFKNPIQQFFKNSKSLQQWFVLPIRFLFLWQIFATSWQMFLEEILDKSVLQYSFH